MKSVLISIQPPHTTNIFNETKCIEWRTKPIPTGKQYIYETKNGGGVGKVIGECSIWRVKRYERVSLIPEWTIEAGCVPYEFLQKYSKGKPLYAHFIVNAKRYDKPKELGEFIRVCSEWEKEEFTPKCHKCDHYFMSWEECYAGCDCDGELPITRPPQSWCYVVG